MTVNAINVTNIDPEAWKAFRRQLALDGLSVTQWTKNMIDNYMGASNTSIENPDNR